MADLSGSPLAERVERAYLSLTDTPTGPVDPTDPEPMTDLLMVLQELVDEFNYNPAKGGQITGELVEAFRDDELGLDYTALKVFFARVVHELADSGWEKFKGF